MRCCVHWRFWPLLARMRTLLKSDCCWQDLALLSIQYLAFFFLPILNLLLTCNTLEPAVFGRYCLILLVFGCILDAFSKGMCPEQETPVVVWGCAMLRGPDVGRAHDTLAPSLASQPRVHYQFVSHLLAPTICLKHLVRRRDSASDKIIIQQWLQNYS